MSLCAEDPAVPGYKWVSWQETREACHCVTVSDCVTFQSAGASRSPFLVSLGSSTDQTNWSRRYFRTTQHSCLRTKEEFFPFNQVSSWRIWRNLWRKGLSIDNYLFTKYRSRYQVNWTFLKCKSIHFIIGSFPISHYTVLSSIHPAIQLLVRSPPPPPQSVLLRWLVWCPQSSQFCVGLSLNNTTRLRNHRLSTIDTFSLTKI